MHYKLIVLASIFIFSSCNVEELEKYNEEFRGEWRSTKYFSPQAGDSIRNYLNINGDDSAFGLLCNENEPFDNCLYFQQGKAKYNKSTKGLQIGNSVQNIYRIDEEPFINNTTGQWELIIDNVTYFKY